MNLAYDKYNRPILTLAALSRRPFTTHKNGTEWRMVCPIHAGTNPTAFSLDVTTGRYYCFSCGAGGQLREYWENLHRNTEPYEAANVAQQMQLYQKQSADPKRLRQLENWYHRSQLLLSYPTAQQYLIRRGIGPDTAVRLGVGYTSDFGFSVVQKDGQGQYIRQKVYAPALLFGLYRPDGFANLYARGISLSRLHHITTGSKGVFNSAAFGKATPSQPVMLVEGCFDVLALAESGYKCAVALCGTALIEPGRYSQLQEVILAFDQDEAGQLRQSKVAEQLRTLGVSCYYWPGEFWQGHKDFAAFWQANQHRNQLDWSRYLAILQRF